MLATTTQVRNMVKSMADMSGNGWERRTWCDKRKAKSAAANERHVTFKFYNSREADFVADELREIFALTGIKAKVTRTTTHDDYMARRSGAEYVRTVATFG